MSFDSYAESRYLIDTNVALPEWEDAYSTVYSFNSVSTLHPNDMLYNLAFGGKINSTVREHSNGTVAYTITDFFLVEKSPVFSVTTSVNADSHLSLSSPISVYSLVSFDGFVKTDNFGEADDRYNWMKTTTDPFGTVYSMSVCSDSADELEGSNIYGITSTYSNDKSGSAFIFNYEIVRNNILSVNCKSLYSVTESMRDLPFVVTDLSADPTPFVQQNYSYPVLAVTSTYENVQYPDGTYTESVSSEVMTQILMEYSGTNAESDFNMYLKYTDFEIPPCADWMLFEYEILEGSEKEYLCFEPSNATEDGFIMTSYMQDENGEYTILNTEFGDNGSIYVQTPYKLFFAFPEEVTEGVIIGSTWVNAMGLNIPVSVWEFKTLDGGTYLLYEYQGSVVKYEISASGADVPHITGELIDAIWFVFV